MSSVDAPDDWLGRALIRWTAFWSGRRWAMAALLVALGVVFSWMSRGVRWQPDVLEFFSADSADVRSAREAAERPGLASQLRLDVHGSAKQKDEDIRTAARELAGLLEKSGEFRMVWTGVGAAEMAARYGRLMAQGPMLLTDEEQAAVESRATADYLSRRFAAVKQHLADPDGEIMLRVLAADPLDLGGTLRGKLTGLAPSGSARTGMEDGLLTARDEAGGLHVMIVTEPRALASDQRGPERVMGAVDGAVAMVRGAHGVEVWVVGAHRGYLENSRQVVRDVTVVGTLGTVLVGLAIAVYFRRLTTALLCMVPPVVGMGLAMGLAGGMRVELPLILLGFAGLLCGSTTDYGIQMIAEARRLTARAGEWTAGSAARAARRLLGPISMSVATSVTGFAALGLSESPGLRGLGLFVAAATVCIWLVTFLVLPVFLGPWVLAKDGAQHTARKAPRGLWRLGTAVFFGATVCLAWQGMHVRFDMNLRALDGASPEARAEEDAFAGVWGNQRNQAIVFVGGPTADEALVRLARVSEYLEDQRRDGQITRVISPAAILPDERAAAARARVWGEFWTEPRRAALRQSLTEAAQANGFSTQGFAAFADRVSTVESTSAEERVRRSPAALFPGFVDQSSGAVTLAAVVQMRSDGSMRAAAGWGAELRTRYPEVGILSGTRLVFDAMERARAEGERLGPWCVLAILLPLWVYLRRLRRAWLAMSCLVAGLVWVLGTAAVFGGGLNLLSLVPVLFTLGVAVDYGIYAATDPAWAKSDPAIQRPGDSANRMGATFLCALTTILGSGALLVAGHPAMRWLGMTLVAGISGGYLASVFAVTPACRRKSRSIGKIGKISGAARWVVGGATRVGAAVLTMALVVPVAAEWWMGREKPAGLEPLGWKAPQVEQVGRRSYVAGRSWMRWRETSGGGGMWEVMLAGGPEERGYAVARLCAPVAVRIENEMLGQLDTFLPEEWSRWLVVRGMATNLIDLPAYIPREDQQELYWTAYYHRDPHDYLGPMYPRLLAYHALHDVSQMLIDNPLIASKAMACTGVVSLPAYSAHGDDGHLYLARIFDFEGGESFGRQKSITYVLPSDGIPYAHVAWPGLSGVVTGMNREKIALYINAAATSDTRRIGTPSILMARQILQHARSIADAEAIIRDTQVFVTDIIVVADGKTGQARVFEKSPARLSQYDVQRSAVVTNLLVTPLLANDPVNQVRIRDGTTLQRNMRARQLLDRMADRVTPEALAGLLRDKRGLDDKDLGLGNRNAVDGLIACHAVIMDVTSGRMWVAAWPCAEGAFAGVNLMRMLDAAANVGTQADADPARLPEDAVMTDGAWEHLLEGRNAAARGAAALAAGRYDEALSAADDLLRDNPGYYEGCELRGRALLARGDRAGAAAALQEALRRDPPYAARRAAIQGLIGQCVKHSD